MIIYSRPSLTGATPIAAPTQPKPLTLATGGFLGAPAAPAPVGDSYINPHGSSYAPFSAPIPAPAPIPQAYPQTAHGSGGDAGSYIRYPIGASEYAAALREAFEITGASTWELASEIVPVYVVNSSGGTLGGENPFSQGMSSVVPAAGHRAFAGLYNGSERIVRIDRVKVKTATSASHYRAVKRTGRVIPGANSGEEAIHFLGDSDVSAGVILDWGTVLVANIHTAGNPIIGHSGGATLHDEAFPRCILQPGQGYYVYHNTDAVANLLIQFEGVQLAP